MRPILSLQNDNADDADDDDCRLNSYFHCLILNTVVYIPSNILSYIFRPYITLDL